MTSPRSLSETLRSRLDNVGLDADEVVMIVQRALDEDMTTRGDVTSDSCIQPSQRSRATFVSRGSGRLAGIHVMTAVVEMTCDASESLLEILIDDGGVLNPGSVIATIEAPTRSLLLAERTALNLLCHLSGIASATAEWVSAVAGTNAVIRDTRKTTPGLRMVEKYAVRCGGGMNHRMNLSDAVLVKDNHVAAAGGIVGAFTLVRGRVKDLPIEIEVDSLDQLTEAISAGVDLILLDNFTVDQMKSAVELRRVHQASFGRPVLLEASGGLTLENARAIATTGVDYLAVGSLTHSSPSLDIGLDFKGPR